MQFVKWSAPMKTIWGLYYVCVSKNAQEKYNTKYHLHCIDKNSETLYMKLF